MQVIVILLLAVISGILYRLGGRGKKGDWLDPVSYKVTRRAGIPVVYLISLLIARMPLSADMFLSAILLGFALSTYHDWLSPDGVNEDFFCFFVTGLCYGLSAIPLYWQGVTINVLIIRTLALSFGTMATLEWKDTWSEWTRGFLVIATLLIFC